jgi:hypothetical protein
MYRNRLTKDKYTYTRGLLYQLFGTITYKYTYKIIKFIMKLKIKVHKILICT